MSYRRFFLNIFFFIPSWVLRIFFWKKDSYIRGQVLDFKSSLLIALTPISTIGETEFTNKLRLSINQTRADTPVSVNRPKTVISKDHNLLSEETSLLLREYIPQNILSKKVILYFHGGGYVIGDVMTHDRWVANMANAMGVRVFSLDYSLAPENKFPKAINDAHLAMSWLNNQNITNNNISLCGDSAGAHLAAATSNYLALNNMTLPSSQCLIYPMTDPFCSSESHSLFAEGYFLTSDIMVWFWEQLRSSNEDNEDPCFNLTKFPNGLNNPKTLIITAGFDPLCDEGEEYASILDKEGVEVEHIHYPNMFHGFVTMTKLKAAKFAAFDFLNDYKKIL